VKLNSALSRDKLLNTLQSINPSFSISRFYTIDSRIEMRLRQAKLIGVLTLSLVSLALCLAAAGIYGVLSYSVQMRRYELGIHLSLGAHTHRLINMVVKQSMMPVLVGIVIGLMLAYAAHLVGSQIWVYQLRADILSFIFALPIIGVIAGVACYWPVKKVISADPIKALRNE
jgi:ABC-type antimicrobial peptide transport system permease subunit